MDRRYDDPKQSVVDTEVQEMDVTLAASTGARIDVWRETDLFHARRAAHVTKPQTCLSVDLFEVIAELADLDSTTRRRPRKQSALPPSRSVVSALIREDRDWS
jgi:hypothetical protein